MDEPFEEVAEGARLTVIATGQPAALADARARQEAHEDGLEDEDHREAGGEPYCTADANFLEHRDTAEGDENNAGDVSQNREQSRRQHHIGGGGAGEQFVVEAVELVIVAALPLDTVAQVARSQNKWDDQHDGVKVVAHPTDEAETPNG